MTDEGELIEEQSEEQRVPEPDELPFYLLERQANRTTKLITTSGDIRPIDGQSRPYRYEFKEPVFVSFIRIGTAGYNEYDSFRFEVTDDQGRKRQFSDRPQNGYIQSNVDAFVKEITFTPPSAWLRTTKINSVQIVGFARSEVRAFIEFAHGLDKLREQTSGELEQRSARLDQREQAVSAKETERDALQQQIGDSETKLAELAREIENQTGRLNEVVAKVGANAKQLEGVEERIGNIRSEVKLETDKKEAAQGEVAKAEARLKELRADIDLFPSEIAGFTKQASSNNTTYLKYAAVPIVIIFTMFALLVIGAVDLTTIITERQDINLSAIVVSRAPYVIVASAIIYASYRLARLFITEVMNINRQRLSLTKISIIAKDISQNAENGLRLSEDQVYQNRLKVKMIMLGDHIKHLISTEPELLFPENLFALPSPAEIVSNISPKRRSKGVKKTSDNEPTNGAD